MTSDVLKVVKGPGVDSLIARPSRAHLSRTPFCSKPAGQEIAFRKGRLCHPETRYLTTRRKEARPDPWILTRWESVSDAFGSEVTGCGQMPRASPGYGKPRKVLVLRRRCDFL